MFNPTAGFVHILLKWVVLNPALYLECKKCILRHKSAYSTFFQKDHVTLKTRVMTAENSDLLPQELHEINEITWF